MTEQQKKLLAQLKKDILLWEGYKPGVAGKKEQIGLGPIEEAFPNGIFPKGVIHEFVNENMEGAAASRGFLSAILGILMKDGGICIWVSKSRKLFPAALQSFGVAPDRIIFVDLEHEKEILWALEEALKCEGLAAVIAEVDELNFTESRRLQLAVEQSKVTGFILRGNPKKINTTICVARWQVNPVASVTDLPGLGHPRWQVSLLKVRNGQPGSWTVEWQADHFLTISPNQQIAAIQYTGT